MVFLILSSVRNIQSYPPALIPSIPQSFLNNTGILGKTLTKKKTMQVISSKLLTDQDLHTFFSASGAENPCT